MIFLLILKRICLYLINAISMKQWVCFVFCVFDRENISWFNRHKDLKIIFFFSSQTHQWIVTDYSHSSTSYVSMSDSQDNENGNDFWMRIQNNNELQINDSINLFNTFLMFLRNDPNCVIVELGKLMFIAIFVENLLERFMIYKQYHYYKSQKIKNKILRNRQS
jgi:hypothetical protein